MACNVYDRKIVKAEIIKATVNLGRIARLPETQDWEKWEYWTTLTAWDVLPSNMDPISLNDLLVMLNSKIELKYPPSVRPPKKWQMSHLFRFSNWQYFQLTKQEDLFMYSSHSRSTHNKGQFSFNEYPLIIITPRPIFQQLRWIKVAILTPSAGNHEHLHKMIYVFNASKILIVDK